MSHKIKQTIIGSRRAQIKFAWLPVITEDGFKIWWEKYLSFEELIMVPDTPIYPGYYYEVPKWIEREAWSQSSTMWDEYEGKV